MNEVPEQVRRLVDQREAARRRKDFARADALRDRIRQAGFDVADTRTGALVRPANRPIEPAAVPVIEPAAVPSLLDRPATFEATVQWVVEGWPEDVARGIESFRRHHPGRSIRHVVVDVFGADPAVWPEDVDLVRLPDDAGWAVARNAGLVRSAGEIVLVADGCVEATGDVLGPLSAALEDRTVGLTGPFGIVTDDLHEFRPSEGPDVDAVEAYLMALRRDLLVGGLRFQDKFRFYRMADVELSFQVKASGLRATVTPVPVVRHEHRIWASTPEDRRAQLSRRNFYRFLDRWRGRLDLTVRGGRR